MTAAPSPEAEAAMPPVDTPYPLAQADLDRFAKDGHVALSGVLDADELATYRDVIGRVVAANLDSDHALHDDVGASANNWQFVNNLWTLDEDARQLIMSPRIARIAAALLDEPRVRLFRDQSYFKGAGGAGTPWHQDGLFTPIAPQKLITAWIALNDMSPQSSPMTYASGSHRDGFLGLSPGGEPAMRQFEKSLTGRGYRLTTYDRLKAGDVAFHAAWTMHATFAHSAPVPREAVVILYCADGVRVVVDPPEGPAVAPYPQIAHVRANSRAISLAGLAHDAPAEGAMVPVVYDRAADPWA